jgi:pectate lyase
MLDHTASVDPSVTVQAIGTYVVQPGSGGGLRGPAAMQPTFMVDVPGTQGLQLAVNDGALGSFPDALVVEAAGPAQVTSEESAAIRDQASPNNAAAVGPEPPMGSSEPSMGWSEARTVADERRDTPASAMAAPTSSKRIPAFPECEGSGCWATGGRSGRVIEVTNVSDSGTGSLRACVEASGPRTCVFRVGGTIELQSGLAVRNPHLTVAGQTAPGGGILISGQAIGPKSNTVWIGAHDVIWRYTRVRVGYHEDCSGDSSHCASGFAMSGSTDIYNVVVDHNSVSWNLDEGIGVWRNSSRSLRDVTISWNLLAEPLVSHPTSLLIGAESRTLADGLTDVDIHHNLVISANHRNPLAKNRSMRLINNIFYNYDFYATHLGGGISIDIIGNYYRAGPDTDPVHEVQAFPGGNSDSANGTLSLYLVGNRGPNHVNPDRDNWSDMTSEVSGENEPEIGPLSERRYRRATPMAARGSPITIYDVNDLDAILLPTVGASQRLDCDGRWVAARDAVDTRLINEYRTGTATGFHIANEDEVGGFPTIARGTPWADADHDGMPDVCEIRFGLDPFDPADGNGDLDGDGYTNLEEFLNG